MSTLFTDRRPSSRNRAGVTGHDHQSNSWLRPLDWLLARNEVRQQRAALRTIADDAHLMTDLGLSGEEALELAGRPFWR